MPTFTGRVVSVVPTTLETKATLDEIFQNLTTASPKSASQTPGWGTVEENDFLLNTTQSAPAGQPVILDGAGVNPRRILARWWFWHRASALVKRNVPDAPDDLQVLAAVDVMISARPGGRFLCLWSTTDRDLAERGGTSLLQAIAANDPKASHLPRSSPLDLVDADVFLWLAHRREHNRTIAAGVNLVKMQGIRAAETAGKSGTLSGDISFDRRAFKQAVADRRPLGPATLTVQLVRNSKPDVLVFDLNRDGSFSPKLGLSIYRSIVDGTAARLAAVADISYLINPAIRDLYQHDAAWTATVRDDLIAKMEVDLRTTYTPAPAQP